VATRPSTASSGARLRRIWRTRRRLLDRFQERSTVRSARECFLSNCAFTNRVYAQLLGKEMAHAV
jgi:hypothetical protein